MLQVHSGDHNFELCCSILIESSTVRNKTQRIVGRFSIPPIAPNLSPDQARPSKKYVLGAHCFFFFFLVSHKLVLLSWTLE